jgi:hypothetical protein
MALPKRLRAKRARARWRDRTGHDLRGQYRESDLPATAHIAVSSFEDPYQPAGRVDRAGNLHAEAELKSVRHHDGSIAEGAPAWTPPQRPTLTAIVNLRNDAIGRMRARRQIDAAQYNAARAFQQLYDYATIGGYSVADLLSPKVDSSRIRDPITAGRMAAAKRLRNVETMLQSQHGYVGLTLTRAILTGGKSVAKAARDFGANGESELRWWGRLFQRCLDVLAKMLGFSNSAQRPRRVRAQQDSAPDPSDSDLHADAGDLADIRLRRARPNGSGHHGR